MAGGLLGVPPGPSKARGRRRPQPPTALQIRLRKDSRAFRSSRPNAEKPSVGEGALSAFGGNRPEFRQDVISGAKGEQEFTSRAAESGDIAISFLRLANLDSEIVDRLSPRTNGPDVEVGIVTRCNDPASGVVLAGAATKAI